MINEIGVIISLALAASFLPLHLGAEIVMLRSERGFRKALAFVSGLASWRVFVALLWIFFAADGVRNARQGPSGILGGISSRFLHEFKPSPVWEFTLEVLLTMAGIGLILYAVRQIARVPGDDELVAEQIAVAEMGKTGATRFDSMRTYRAFWFGFLWLAIGVNSYLLMFAAYQQITLLPAGLVPKLTMLFAFLILSNTLLAIPLLIYMLSPGHAQSALDAFYSVFQRVGRWIGILLAAAIGVYLTWQGLGELLFR